MESVKQHLLEKKAVPDDYWAAVDVRTELLSSGVLTKTAQAEQIKEAVEALTGRSRVRPQHQACKVAAPLSLIHI